MENLKIIISIVAVILTFFGYIPYIRDVLQGKTKPHIYTWFVWGFVTAIGYGLQVGAGAGVGSWLALAVIVNCFFIFVLGLKNGKKDITKSDTVFLLLSFVAIFLWLIAKQPVISVVLISTIGLLGFVPTIRKAWGKPYSETLFTYKLNIFRHGLNIFALQQYNIVTWLYPATWTIMNLLFSVMLIIRRKQVGK